MHVDVNYCINQVIETHSQFAPVKWKAARRSAVRGRASRPGEIGRGLSCPVHRVVTRLVMPKGLEGVMLDHQARVSRRPIARPCGSSRLSGGTRQQLGQHRNTVAVNASGLGQRREVGNDRRKTVLTASVEKS